MREQILHACFPLFARQGVRSVVVDDLITSAGVSRAAFYGSVRSKEEVVFAYLQRLYLLWASAIDSAVAARGQGPEALLGIFDAIEAICGDEGTGRASFVHVLGQVGPEDPLGKATIEQSARLREHIAALADAAGLRRPREFAAECQILLDGCILSYSQGSMRPLGDVESLARVLIWHHLRPRSLRDARKPRSPDGPGAHRSP